MGGWGVRHGRRRQFSSSPVARWPRVGCGPPVGCRINQTKCFTHSSASTRQSAVASSALMPSISSRPLLQQTCQRRRRRCPLLPRPRPLRLTTLAWLLLPATFAHRLPLAGLALGAGLCAAAAADPLFISVATSSNLRQVPWGVSISTVIQAVFSSCLHSRLQRLAVLFCESVIQPLALTHTRSRLPSAVRTSVMTPCRS